MLSLLTVNEALALVRAYAHREGVLWCKRPSNPTLRDLFTASPETNPEGDGMELVPTGTRVYGQLAQSKPVGRRQATNMKSTRHSAQIRKDAISVGCCPTPEVFSELVQANSRLIYKVSLDILKNHADAEDNLQSVFIKVHSNIHQFEGRSQLSSWLVRVAINEALMAIRKRKFSAKMLPIDPVVPNGNCEVHRIRDRRPDPERQCIANELLGKVLDGLSPRLRDAFVLTTGGGWTQQEFADAMGISVGTVKARIFRARTRMRQRLDGLRLGSEKTASGGSSGIEF